ncbi:MAG: GTP-binding protein [Pseudomonadota bacterium]
MSQAPPSPDLEAIRQGGKRALAAALTRVETHADDAATAALLDAALEAPVGLALGLTGPPGVGKSTLIDALIRGWRTGGQTVAVIAVDPSSMRSGGALLGDRTRLTTDPSDDGVFVRSMAARDQLGGVAAQTFPAMVLMRAIYDRVIIETVGVGQSEIAISGIADMVAFCAQPGSGDGLQYMKAGVMEVPDLVIVTKADLKAMARQTAADLKGALTLSANRADTPVILCSAATGEGVDEAIAALDDRAAALSPRFAEDRARQASRWVDEQVRIRFGQAGLEAVHKQPVDKWPTQPFRRFRDMNARLSGALSAAFQ